MTTRPPDDPKRRVLAHLKVSRSTSTREVARLLGVSDVAARQHLQDLERQGLVLKTTASPAGKGRPGDVWRLSALANDIFPDRHDALAVDLIESIRSALGAEGLNRVVQARTKRQLECLRAVVPPRSPLRERLDALARQRSEEGYMAAVEEASDGGFLLVEHHCPICDAASACQLFCLTELELFQQVLGPGVEIEREEHLLSGDERCIYRVRPTTAAS